MGYNATTGTSGFISKIHYIPSPHEKDVTFYDGSRQRAETAQKPSPVFKTNFENYRLFGNVVDRGGWVIVFVGPETMEPSLVVVNLHGKVELKVLKDSKDFRMTDCVQPPFDVFYQIFKVFHPILPCCQILGTVTWAIVEDELRRPISTLLINPNTKGGYLILPRFQSNLDVVELILSDVLPEVNSQLFPQRPGLDWLSDEFYDSPKVREIRIGIRKREEEYLRKQREDEDRIDAIELDLKPFMQILIADDEHFTGEDRLSKSVEHVFDFLDFKVTNVDEENPYGDGKKREDLWVRDKDGYFGICECKGTKSGESETFYGDLLKYVRHAHRKLKETDLRGLLVVNPFRERDAKTRGPLYAGSPEIIASAKDAGDGILSTFTLWRICMDVMSGSLDKSEAREIIKQPGLIKYGP